MNAYNQNKSVSVIMVGTGGYGHYYTNVLIKEYYRGLIDLKAAVEPFPENSSHTPWFLKQSIPVFPTLEEAFKDGIRADLVIISSPLHYHVPQSILALEQGSHVLCDKPVASTIQDAQKLIAAKNKKGLHVLVGYQWSFSSAIQALKRDIQKGSFGKPVRIKTLCLWPRGFDYYSRNDWAGKIKDKEGKWILDSPANNAMAHFLHNLLYLLGEEKDSAALPVFIEAETYKAYDIQNFDTVASRMLVSEGTELLFYASHSIRNRSGPMFKLEFEKATVTYGEDSKSIVSKDPKGQIISDYGDPESEDQFKKFYDSIKVIKGLKSAACSLQAAFPHTLAVNGIQDSVPQAPSFPASFIEHSNTGERLWVKELGETLYSCYLNSCLPSEKGVKWAVKGKKVDMQTYTFFPGGRPQNQKKEK